MGDGRADGEDARHSRRSTDNAIAAMAGAITTSFLMTPLDVVKTRLQMQHDQLRGSLFAGSRPDPAASGRTLLMGRASDVLERTAVRGNAGCTMPLTVNASGMCVHPELCQETCRHARPSPRSMGGFLDGVLKIAQNEGMSGLWRGLLPTLAMTVPSQITYMMCYDWFRTGLMALETTRPSVRTHWDAELENAIPVLMDGEPCIAAPSSADVPMGGASEAAAPGVVRVGFPLLGASLLAGASARAISASLVTPLELLRTRLQASNTHHAFTSVVQPLLHEVQQNGVSVLWRGLSATLWRDVPFSAIYFAGYEGGKHLFTGGGLGANKAAGFWNEFAVSFFVGAGSGSVAAVLTHPFDVLKTRLQAENAVVERSSVRAALKALVRDEGTGALFRGLSPRLAKVAPSCGIMIGSFEVVGRLLASSRASRQDTQNTATS